MRCKLNANIRMCKISLRHQQYYQNIFFSLALRNKACFLDSDSEIDNSDEKTTAIRSKAFGKVVSIRKIRTSGL
jgi:hypothetical protein